MFNKIVLVGNLGTEPKFTETNGIAASFPLATSTCRNEDYDDPLMTIDWHRIVAPPALLEECKKLKKNDVVLVEGELKTSPRSRQNNNKGPQVLVYTTEVLAHTINFLSRECETNAEERFSISLLAANDT